MTVPKPVRRTQEERSAIARETLINATLVCLTELGFSKTTVTEICREAGLTRGALLHHFPAKNDLVVAAYISWLEDKLQRLTAQVNKGPATVRDEILAWRQQTEATFAMTHEFYWALRNDDDLRERFSKAMLSSSIGADISPALAVSELEHSPDPELTRYVIACFIRGLCFQTLFVRDIATIDQAFEHFVEILTSFVSTKGGR
jgi:AcrR family transcriptional regulator